MGVVGAVGAAGAVGVERMMELRLGLALGLAGPRGRETEAIRALAASGPLQLAVGGHTPTTAICARLICPIAALDTVGVGEVAGSTRGNQQNNRRRISRPQMSYRRPVGGLACSKKAVL